MKPIILIIFVLWLAQSQTTQFPSVSDYCAFPYSSTQNAFLFKGCGSTGHTYSSNVQWSSNITSPSVTYGE